MDRTSFMIKAGFSYSTDGFIFVLLYIQSISYWEYWQQPHYCKHGEINAHRNHCNDKSKN
jgi:hypothetical protein